MTSPLSYKPAWKPRPGAHRLKKHGDKATVRTTEKKNKVSAKVRDGHRCRAPHATREEYETCAMLRIESGHVQHKGMGGNPTGDRNEVAGFITFGLRCHKERFDKELLRPRFLSDDRANGLIAWEERETHDAPWVETHVEAQIGDANDRWRRRR